MHRKSASKAPHIGASPKSKAEHMARRAKYAPQKKVAAEFGTSQSTVSRKMLRNGYVSGGKA